MRLATLWPGIFFLKVGMLCERCYDAMYEAKLPRAVTTANKTCSVSIKTPNNTLAKDDSVKIFTKHKDHDWRINMK